MEIDCHIVRDKNKEGLIRPLHVPSRDQVAYIFTKTLATALFRHFCSKLGLVQLTNAPT